jgi:hypothetical protein
MRSLGKGPALLGGAVGSERRRQPLVLHHSRDASEQHRLHRLADDGTAYSARVAVSSDGDPTENMGGRDRYWRHNDASLRSVGGGFEREVQRAIRSGFEVENPTVLFDPNTSSEAPHRR